MALIPGTRLGVYEIAAQIGEGGMGAVYRATDTSLGRQVAVKVLPDAFAQDAERLARFEREAKTLAALNHPNIAAIYGLERSSGTQALVMELVEGGDLSQRIARGSIPLDETLAVARQIAEALQAAHEKGIIHRDLKPANIAVTSDGRVKVLDFGLAKAFESDVSASLSNSPTLTIAATGAGVILGTAAYMSPEQAKGRVADKRSDIWAFGCVLYEMLTGARAFEGEDVSDTLANVLKSEPDWNALPSEVPISLRALLRRCLMKDRQQRIADIAVALFLLSEPAAVGPIAEGDRSPVGDGRSRAVWAAGATVFFLTTLALAAALVYVTRSNAAPGVVRFDVQAPDKTAFDIRGGTGGSPAGDSGTISPDGRRLVFTLQDATGSTRLWVRAIDSRTAQPLAGTEGANLPFWSPDSRFVGFGAAGKLKKIDVEGGPPLTLCDAPSLRGGSWSANNVIVFAPSISRPIYRVAAAGGTPTQVTKMQPGDSFHRSPWFLPDGRHFLYRSVGANPGNFLGALDSEETTRLNDADTNVVYAPPGYLLFVRQNTLLVQAFDARKLRISGEPFPVAEQVATDVANGFGAFSVSNTGALTYRPGREREGNVQMTWIDRQGKKLESVGLPGPYRGVALSDDGARLALHRDDGQGGDIWLQEQSRAPSRFTFDATRHSQSPVWSPDGRSVVYSSSLDGKRGLYRKPSNNSGSEELLFENASALPTSWSKDGRSIVFTANDPNTGADVWALSRSDNAPAAGSGSGGGGETWKPTALLHAAFNESGGHISPDGKWLAYASNETGQMQIYVQPFPPGAGKWQISTAGGTFPTWRGDGREMFYLAPSGMIVGVDVEAGGSTFLAGVPKELFATGFVNFSHGGGGPYAPYAVSPDGQRFLIPRPSDTDVMSSFVTVVLNWQDALTR